jgi:hypothetical protein
MGIESEFVAFFDDIGGPEMSSPSFIYNNETEEDDADDADNYNDDDEINHEEYEQDGEKISCNEFNDYDEGIKFAIYMYLFISFYQYSFCSYNTLSTINLPTSFFYG